MRQYQQNICYVMDGSVPVARCVCEEDAQAIVERLNNLADALDAERKARREAEAELRASDREEMPRLMSDLSEQHWCASWLNTTDTDLWGMIHEGRKREWGMDIVSDEALARLRVLSERLGEWYDGGEFIPLDKWKAQRSLARAAGEGKAPNYGGNDGLETRDAGTKLA